MSYRTILFYKCSHCSIEYQFDCPERGPKFNQEEWTTIDIRIHKYQADGQGYRNEKKYEGLFCPSCTETTNIDMLTIDLLKKSSKEA